jgi:two-component system, cell cycle sensor histidine kinase and response regulator CckA
MRRTIPLRNFWDWNFPQCAGGFFWEMPAWNRASPELRDTLQRAVLSAGRGEQAAFLLELGANATTPATFLDFSVKPVRNDDTGAVAMVIAECHDITSRVHAEMALKESEAQFKQAQKMDAIGRLAGGVAHDFNNLLTSILGFSHLVMDGLKEGETMHRDMMEVIASAERARDLTQKLLTFARKKPEHTERVNMNSLLRNAEKLIRVSLHEDIEYVPKYGDNLGLVEIDAVSIDQIIVNLAVNARDAMPRSGRLYAETKRVYLDDAFCRKYDNAKPGWYAMLSMRDTGYGMSQEVLDRAFEPFFSTKEPGEGTGLGLSTVYGIVQQHKGIIVARSNAGEGAEFQIYFPEVTDPAAVETRRSGISRLEPGQMPTGTETILLVEDEEALRKMGVKLISSLGYKVITAKDGEDGCEVYTRHGKDIDLIVSDVVMPNMSGPEMIRKIKTSRKDIRFIFVSGFTRDKLEKLGATGPDLTVIQKPYSRETLARKIREQLDRVPDEVPPPA